MADKIATFEAVLIGSSKTKDGEVIRLAIHPSDVPELLIRSPVGQRYMCVMHILDDDPKTQEEIVGEKAVKFAAAYARDPDLARYYAHRKGHPPRTLEDVEQFIREACGVESRAELRTNKRARDQLYALKDMVDRWK